MNAKVTPTPSGYVFDWPDLHLHIKVTRVHAHRDDRVTGELVITSNGTTPAVILKPHTQFNFLADPRRSGLSKILAEDLPEVQWKDVIDYLCHEVVERARAGEPLLRLNTEEIPDPPRWLLRPILMENLPTLVFGEKSAFKTTIGQLIMATLVLPWAENHLSLNAPDRPVPSLWLDWETDARIFAWNMRKLQVGMGLPFFKPDYRRCYMPLADDIEQIQEYMEDCHAEVAFIDSLAQAAGGDIIKDTERALSFFRALRELKVSSYIIGQTSKTDEGKKTPYGNAIFTYYARNIFELYRPDETDNSVGLFHRWSNIAPITAPVGFHVSIDDEITVVESQSVTVEEFRKKVSASAKILDLLKRGSFSIKEIMESCNLGRDETDHAAFRLKKAGKVIKLPDGKLALPSR